ncbi:MAG TPA: hypothetical protein VER96_20050 [Polyangiaceae bacterium]|nr:hypothetical protein [Polyangiaceae bacterium]
MERLLAAQNAPLIGHSSLAAGSDQIFAEVVLQSGGTLEVVRPFPSYRDRIEGEEDRRVYDRLLAAARRVDDVTEAFASNDEAYLLAGKQVVERSQLMIAVWDGEEQLRVGSTAHIVHFARERRCPVIVLDPIQRTTARHG